MKKIICMALALILCVGLLVGCGAKEAAEEAGEEVSAAVSQTGAEVGQLNTSGSSTMGSQATPPPAEAKFQDHLTVLIDDKVALVNPFNAGSRTSQMGNVQHLCYDTLINWNLDGDYVPCLAKEWTANDDTTVWNFKLRDDVTFHNGEHFTADDVVFTWEFASQPDAAGTGIQTLANKMEYVKALGDYEVEIKLKVANPDFE